MSGKSRLILSALALYVAALTTHWVHVWRLRNASEVAGIRLVVFGPSSWDTFAPGAPEEVVTRVTTDLDARFEIEHPQVTHIVHDARGPIADGLARLRNAEVAGDQLDVVVCAADPVNTAYAREGLIRPLDDLVSRIHQRFILGAVENFTVDGHVWAAPLSAVNITTFFYNQELWAKIAGTTPKTYGEFRALVPRFQAAQVIPVVHQGKNPWMWLIYYMSALAQTTDNHEVEFVEQMLEGTKTFTDERNVRALRLARAWVDDGLLDAQSNELDENAMKSVFYSGKAAAFFGETWDISGIASNARFKWGVFPFPQYESESGHAESFGGVDGGLCLAATTKQHELATAYIEFATRDENAQRLLEPLRAFATSHMNVIGENDDISRELRSRLPAAKSLDWIFPLELADFMQRAMQAMMGQTQTPEQTAANIQAKYEALVQAGYSYRPTQGASPAVKQ